jgi:DNA-binding NarL/FixJ family response regulator
MKTRVVVADDNPAVLSKLVSILQRAFEVVGTAADGSSAIECAARENPDVVVLDLEMNDLNGIEVTRRLHLNYRPYPIVICSVETDRAIVEKALNAGVMGFVFKLRMGRDLIPAVNSAARGQSFVSQL